jgi:N-carbamoylputrescine amidase
MIPKPQSAQRGQAYPPPTPHPRCASADLTENILHGDRLIRQAADQGAQIILLQELFGGPYFCQEMSDRFFCWARSVEESEIVNHFKALAKELSVVRDNL